MGSERPAPAGGSVTRPDPVTVRRLPQTPPVARAAPGPQQTTRQRPTETEAVTGMLRRTEVTLPPDVRVARPWSRPPCLPSPSEGDNGPDAQRATSEVAPRVRLAPTRSRIALVGGVPTEDGRTNLGPRDTTTGRRPTTIPPDTERRTGRVGGCTSTGRPPAVHGTQGRGRPGLKVAVGTLGRPGRAGT